MIDLGEEAKQSQIRNFVGPIRIIDVDYPPESLEIQMERQGVLLEDVG